MDILLRGDRREPAIALTFDDGPGDWTPALLDLLAAHGAPATFFVLGRSVAGREAAVQRAAAEGHELGNHGWSHAAVWRLDDAEVRAELERTQALLRGAVDAPPVWARPPYGRDYARFARLAWSLGLRTALWSIDPRDWAEPPAERIIARVLAELHPGAIVDLHDGFHDAGRTTAQHTVDAVTVLLPELARRGYRCVTLSQLARRGPRSSAAR